MQQKAAALSQGIANQIAKYAYLQRQRFHLMTFGNNAIKQLFNLKRVNKGFDAAKQGVRFAGGTPFTLAMQQVAEYVKKIKQQESNTMIILYIITDGRVKEINVAPVEVSHTAVIDIELATPKFGRAQQIAQQLHAQYIRGSHG